jgi:hypothetical protein
MQMPNDEEVKLPESLTSTLNIKWLKPEEYIRNYQLDKEIKITYPNKQTVKMRNDIKETYHNEKNRSKDTEENEYEKDDEEARKKRIYKEFYRMIEKNIETKVVHSFERDETEEEYKKRRDEEIQIEKQKQEALTKTMKKPGEKDKKPAANQKKVVIEEKKEEIPEYRKISELSPSNISITDKYDRSSVETTSNYNRWISSVFQVIKDLYIPDAYVIYKFTLDWKDNMAQYLSTKEWHSYLQSSWCLLGKTLLHGKTNKD